MKTANIENLNLMPKVVYYLNKLNHLTEAKKSNASLGAMTCLLDSPNWRGFVKNKKINFKRILFSNRIKMQVHSISQSFKFIIFF